MTILTRIKLWNAERSLGRISLELAAARDYLDATMRAYEHEGYSRDDLVADILDVRAHVEELSEEHSYVRSYIERLKNGQLS